MYIHTSHCRALMCIHMCTTLTLKNALCTDAVYTYCNVVRTHSGNILIEDKYNATWGYTNI
jgi:hypothetical protein